MRVSLPDVAGVYLLPWKKPWFIIDVLLCQLIAGCLSGLYFYYDDYLEGWLMFLSVLFFLIARAIFALIPAAVLKRKLPARGDIVTVRADANGITVGADKQEQLYSFECVKKFKETFFLYYIRFENGHLILPKRQLSKSDRHELNLLFLRKITVNKPGRRVFVVMTTILLFLVAATAVITLIGFDPNSSFGTLGWS